MKKNNFKNFKFEIFQKNKNNSLKLKNPQKIINIYMKNFLIK